MTLIEKTCGVCGRRIVLTENDLFQFSGMDIDFRPTNIDYEDMLEWIHECPECEKYLMSLIKESSENTEADERNRIYQYLIEDALRIEVDSYVNVEEAVREAMEFYKVLEDYAICFNSKESRNNFILRVMRYIKENRNAGFLLLSPELEDRHKVSIDRIFKDMNDIKLKSLLKNVSKIVSYYALEKFENSKKLSETEQMIGAVDYTLTVGLIQDFLDI